MSLDASREEGTYRQGAHLIGGGDGGGEGEAAARRTAAQSVPVKRRWVHPLGGEYEGEWRGDEWSGRGVYTWSNGDRYVGQVKKKLSIS